MYKNLLLCQKKFGQILAIENVKKHYDFSTLILNFTFRLYILASEKKGCADFMFRNDRIKMPSTTVVKITKIFTLLK